LHDGKFAYHREITSSMPKPFWFFSSNSSRPLVVQDDVSWSQVTDAVENQFTIWRKPNQALRQLCAIT
jgi:hypothetical protein